MANVLAVIPGYHPSAIINVIKPLASLQAQGKIGFDVQTELAVMPWHLRGVDVVVACRNVKPVHRHVFEYAALCGIPIIYDIDDNLFGVPAYDVFSHQHYEQRKPQLEAYLQQAILIRAHADELVQIVRDYNPNVKRVYGSIDWSLIPDDLPPVRDNPLEIVYATGRRYGDGLFAIVAADIQRVLDDLNGRAVLRCIGYHPPQLKGHPHVIFQPFEEDYDAYIRHLATHGYALSIAPMPDDTFHRSKTNVKFRDYGAAGVAGVYQQAAVYNEVVHKETGWVVSGEPGSWYTAIMALIEDRALLENIRRAAQRTVYERYRLDVAAQDWHHDIEMLSAAHPRSPLKPLPAQMAAGWLRGFMIGTAQQLYHALPEDARVAFNRLRLRLRSG